MIDYSQLTVLIVDDTPDNIFSLNELLKKNGIKTDSATSADIAMRKMLKNEYALVLLDVQMPDMDGFQLAEHMKGSRKTQHIPILFITAYATETKFLKKGLSLGAVDYVTKPFDADILLLKVKNMLQMSITDRELNLANQKLEIQNKLLDKKINRIDFSYYALFYNSPATILVLDKNGTIQDCNKVILPFDNFQSKLLISQHIANIPLEIKINDEPLHYHYAAIFEQPSEFAFLEASIYNEGKIIGYTELYFTKVKNELEEDLLLLILKDITKGKEAQLALEAERNLLQKVMKNMPFGIYISNDKYELKYVNPVLEDLYGKIKNKPCFQYFHDTDAPCSFCRNEAVFKGHTVTWHWTSPDLREYQLTDIPLRTSDNEKLKMQLVFDVTDAKRAETKLKKSEEKYRTLFENINDGVLQADPTGRLLLVNSALCKMLGYSMQEILSKETLITFAHKNEHTKILEKLKERVAGKSDVFETVLIHKDNSLVYVRLNARPIIDNSGKVMSLLAVISDISPLVKQQNFIKENEAFIRGVFNSMGSHIAVADESGTILYTNDAWKNFALENNVNLNRVAEGSNYFAACKKAAEEGDEIAARALHGIIMVLAGNIPSFSIEYPCHSSSTQRWFLFTATLFKGSQSKIVLRHVNITERKEQQARLTNAALNAQEKEKERIARDLHDSLGQKLMALKLLSANMEFTEGHALKENSNWQNMKEYIAQSIDETRSLTHQLVTPEFTDMGLFEAVDAMINRLQKFDSIKYHISRKGIVKKLPENTRIHLYRVIQEFIRNSQKYAKAQNISISFAYTKDALNLVLKDDGIGFNINKVKTQKNGIGLINIEHRLSSIPCTFHIQSEAQKGATLSIVVYY